MLEKTWLCWVLKKSWIFKKNLIFSIMSPDAVFFFCMGGYYNTSSFTITNSIACLIVPGNILHDSRGLIYIKLSNLRIQSKFIDSWEISSWFIKFPIWRFGENSMIHWKFFIWFMCLMIPENSRWFAAFRCLSEWMYLWREEWDQTRAAVKMRMGGGGEIWTDECNSADVSYLCRWRRLARA